MGSGALAVSIACGVIEIEKEDRIMDEHEFRDLIRPHIPQVVRALAEIAVGESGEATKALRELVSRGFGKPGEDAAAVVNRIEGMSDTDIQNILSQG
jgi:hypothetical protein